MFQLDELKLQSNGGKGLTLMDVDAGCPLISVASCADVLTVIGSGRGGKPRSEDLRAPPWPRISASARKGRKVDGMAKLPPIVA